MRFPDGRVTIFTDEGKNIRVEEKELVKCKNCTHHYTMEDAFRDEITKLKDPDCVITIRPVCDLGDDGWCCRGEKKE